MQEWHLTPKVWRFFGALRKKTEEAPPRWDQTWVIVRKTQQGTPPGFAKPTGSTSKAPGLISPPPSPRGVALGDTGTQLWGHSLGSAGGSRVGKVFPHLNHSV